MAAFSRLQLAAALLEYDNDLENPNAPFRSAQDSAIFAHMRRSNRPRRGSGFESASRRSTDYLGVALPSETGSGSADLTRRSRASIDALQNPFGDQDDDEEPDPEDLDVDLASWGLDTFMPKEKGSRASRGMKGKTKSPILPNPHNDWDSGSALPRPSHDRAMSMGDFGAGDAFLEARSSLDPGMRRNSISNPLDMASSSEHERPDQRRRASSHALIEMLPVRTPLHSSPKIGPQERDTIPFPSTMEPDSEQQTLEEPNPFALRPPSPDRASRFDPKALHARTASNATALSGLLPPHYNDENRDPSTGRPSSRNSRIDARSIGTRRLSNGSLGTRNMLDNDTQSLMSGAGQHEREIRYSRLDLMRPKVLIMPSPLQSTPSGPKLTPSTMARDGFLLSSDGPPLPPGARSSRTLSTLQPSLSTNIPLASNSFTPNPRMSLSAAQLLFRNTLMVGGERDVTYADIDGSLRRAQEEGEQAQQEWPEEPKPEPPASAPEVETVTVPVEVEIKTGRPPGKLFGKSLIDDLEARKAEIQGKRRVFTGDQRPSMMDRGPKRSSTLIDPVSLQQRPKSQHIDSVNSKKSLQSTLNLTRRGSRNSKPLLSFGADGELSPSASDGRMTQSKSVFGVDTLWEREMAKLREIEVQEAIEAEEARKRDEAEMNRSKDKKKKGKGKEKQAFGASAAQPSPELESMPRKSSSLPPVLPDVSKVTGRRKGPVQPPEESDDESSSSEIHEPSATSPRRNNETDAWVSEDEDVGPMRTAGTGRQFSQRSPTHQRSMQPDDSDDEDVPLAATIARVTHKLSAPRRTQDSSDEDQPLSALLVKKSDLRPIDFDNLVAKTAPRPNDTDSDEDDVPLGVRVSRLPPVFGSAQAGDEDDVPLALHPEQQRRTQYQMMAAQQQQQQMLFQAQMNSMAFGAPPSLMGSAFSPFVSIAPPPMATMMVPPPTSFGPPPQDNAKFGRVDRWRRDVAVEGPP